MNKSKKRVDCSPDIGRCLRQGKIGMEGFIGFVGTQRPMNHQLLKVGDYVAVPNPLRADSIDLEKVAEIDYLERGDFRTSKGTTGPLRGNVFVRVERTRNSTGTYVKYSLIEGDQVTKDTEVYRLAREYQESQAA
jgi:hypothetical protein